jgi:hypothetical protein
MSMSNVEAPHQPCQSSNCRQSDERMAALVNADCFYIISRKQRVEVSSSAYHSNLVP